MCWKTSRPLTPTLRGSSVLRGGGGGRAEEGGREGGRREEEERGGKDRKKKNEGGNCSVGRNPPSPFPGEEVD